jgi:hypothetical protein
MNVETFMHLEGGINIHYETGAFQGGEAPGVFFFEGVKLEVKYGSGVRASISLNLCTRWMRMASFTN